MSADPTPLSLKGVWLERLECRKWRKYLSSVALSSQTKAREDLGAEQNKYSQFSSEKEELQGAVQLHPLCIVGWAVLNWVSL